MNTNKDILDTLFSRMPEAELPGNFRANLMRQIQAEAVRASRKKERLGLLSVMLASVVMIALAIVAFVYSFNGTTSGVLNGISGFKLPHFSDFSLYLLVGAAALLLLVGDYLMRNRYKKKHSCSV